MGIFGWNKSKEKLVLVFHVGSSFVGGTLFHTQKSGIPKIIISIREPITLQETLDVDSFFPFALKSLDIVAGKIYKAGIGKPAEIFCVLSSLWYVSQTRVIKLEKNAPFLFTTKLADSLIQKEKDLFIEEHSEKYSRSGMGIRLMELKNIRTMINGYETSAPLDQKGSDLEMTIFISMSGDQILKKIEETIRNHFHFKEIRFSSFGFSSFAVVRDIYTYSEDFILIDVGGEVADVAMIKKNVLRESISFPYGLNFMVRGVASASQSSLVEAKSLISLLKDGHATKTVMKRLGPVVDNLKKEWLMKFQESLSNLSNDISIPDTIYLAIDEEMADFFSEIIKSEQFSQYILTESKFKVTFLNAKIFHGMAVFKEDVIRDPFLIIDSIYINRFLIRSVHLTKEGEKEQA